MIGSLTMSKKYQIIDSKEIENRLKISEFKVVATNVQSLDICQLPNGFLATCSGDSFSLYDHKLELIKTFNEINGKKVNTRNIAIDYIDSIYFTDTANDQLVMCNSAFMYQRSIGSKGSEKNQFREPCGLFYHKNNKRLYVCDSGNNRVGIFTSKLEFIKNNLITFRPFEIKIINNVACVRSFNTFDQQLHFYNLPNFTIQSTYKDFHQPISVIQNSFYQFDPQNELLYCFDSNGIQIDQISSTGVRNLIQSNSDGILTQFNNQLILLSNKQECLIVI